MLSSAAYGVSWAPSLSRRAVVMLAPRSPLPIPPRLPFFHMSHVTTGTKAVQGAVMQQRRSGILCPLHRPRWGASVR